MIHVVVVGLVVLFTPRIVHTHPRLRELEHPIVYNPPPPRDIPPGVRWRDHVMCQCIAPLALDVVPPTIPGIDISLAPPSTDIGARAIDTWDGASHERGNGGGQTQTGVVSANVVDVQVAPYPGAPTPRYPEALREAGIEGEVTLEFVVDTTGRVERGSVRVLSSAADAFVVSVRDALAGTRYHPALVGGRRVRQLVRQGFVFSLTQH
jgi:TonB family protein